MNCRISTPFARSPKRAGPPTKPVTVPFCRSVFAACTVKLRGIMLALPEMQPAAGHCSAGAKLPSEDWPFWTPPAFAVISAVGTASISPRPI